MKMLRLLFLLVLVSPALVMGQAAKAKKTKKEAAPAAAVEAPAPAPAKAFAWDVDATHSYLTFSVRHFFTPVPGTFDKFTGTVHFDPANLENSSVDFTVDVKSVQTKNDKRNAHLLSPDFFNADSFATMRFVSSSFAKTGENAFVARGKMTIKNVTKDVEIPFLFLGQQDHPWAPGKIVAGLKTNFNISRIAYGVGTGNWVQTSVVGDDVAVELNLEVTRTK